MKKGFATLCILIVLAGSFMANTTHVKAQSTNIYISSDGSVVGTNSIQRNGDLYVLTGNISGGIVVQKSNIIIDGAGFTLQGNGGTGVDLQNNLTEVPSSQEIWNVTIKNLGIINFHFGILTSGGGNDTLHDDYIATSMSGSAGAVSFWGCSGNNITYCTIIGETAVDMQFGSSRNTITENNLAGSVWVEIGGDETVDRNYWSDYFTQYPNATEIVSTGIGNTPYVFYSYVNSVSGLSSSPLYDNHPQINPVNLPIFPAPLATVQTKQLATPTATSFPSTTLSQTPNPIQSLSPSPSLSSTPSSTIPEFPSWIILPLFMAAAIITGIFLRKKIA